MCILPRRVECIDWRSWRPTERATLLFVVKDGCILLIFKKRGLGAGKINGPGGRVEPGETTLDCALREVREELCINALGVTLRGALSFQFMDGYAMQGSVFTADDYRGAPTETGEARPLWFPLAAIPYHRMWPDDRLWMPLMLAGKNFRGRFTFDGERMLDHDVKALAGGERIE